MGLGAICISYAMPWQCHRNLAVAIHILMQSIARLRMYIVVSTFGSNAKQPVSHQWAIPVLTWRKAIISISIQIISWKFFCVRLVSTNIWVSIWVPYLYATLCRHTPTETLLLQYIQLCNQSLGSDPDILLRRSMHVIYYIEKTNNNYNVLLCSDPSAICYQYVMASRHCLLIW